LRRRIGLFLVVGVVLPLVVAATASAQGSTLQLSVQTASPGQSVTATGGSFSSAAGFSSVSIRLSTRDGRILTDATPDSRGRIEARFRAPSVDPGEYLILATQTSANGRQRAFTPARTTLRVVAAGSGAVAPPGGGSPGGGPPIAPLAAATLALTLLAAGSTLTVRRLRTTRARPLSN
jgi:hypothetical protein